MNPAVLHAPEHLHSLRNAAAQVSNEVTALRKQLLGVKKQIAGINRERAHTISYTANYCAASFLSAPQSLVALDVTSRRTGWCCITCG